MDYRKSSDRLGVYTLTVNLYVPAASPVSVQVLTFLIVFVPWRHPLLRSPHPLHVPLVNVAFWTSNPTGGFLNHVRTISPTFAPATAQTLAAVDVHAVSAAALPTLPLMTGALIPVSLSVVALLWVALPLRGTATTRGDDGHGAPEERRRDCPPPRSRPIGRA